MKKAGAVEGEEGDAVADAAPNIYTGSCQCGAVTYTALDLSDIWYCHCTQCQKLTGHHIAAAGTLNENLTVEGDVKWSPISEKSESGHCPTCNAYLFWRAHGRPTVSVLVGSVDDTAGLEAKGHIYVAEKADYYEITDGLPQYDFYPEGVLRNT